MKTSFHFGLLGISKSENDDLIRFIKKYIPHANFSYLEQVPMDLSKFRSVILNIHWLRAQPEESLAYLRDYSLQGFPLHLYGVEKNFEDLAVAVDLANGVLLMGPFDENMGKSLQKEKSSGKSLPLELQGPFQGIFDHLNDFMPAKDDDDFYSILDKLMQKNYGTAPLVVFSSRKGEEGLLDLSVKKRTKWNIDSFIKHYDEDQVDSFLRDKVSKQELSFVEDRFYHDAASALNFIPLGQDDKQFHWGVFSAKDIKVEEFSSFVQIVRYAFQQFLIRKLERKLTSLVYVDDVTGLFNQRRLRLDLDEAITNYEEKQTEFSVLFIDIDHFKKVNDSYGHRIGSLVLMNLAKLLKRILRETDLVYRYGGDEFVVIIPNEHQIPELGQKIGMRILNSVAKTTFEPDGKVKLNIGVSIGVSDFPADAKTKEDILVTADVMMYKAKASGRGRVCYAKAFLDDKDSTS